jgi:hypothetical protein
MHHFHAGIWLDCAYLQQDFSRFKFRIIKGIIHTHAVLSMNTPRLLNIFIHGLNDKTSRGIPVGPAASIVLAEVVLSDIDRKILSHTSSFVRWVDDFHIFFRGTDEARVFLHEFTKYLYEVHRLVLSGEKTRLLRVSTFTSHVFRDDEETERLKRQAKIEELALEEYWEQLSERVGPYSSPEEAAGTGAKLYDRRGQKVLLQGHESNSVLKKRDSFQYGPKRSASSFQSAMILAFMFMAL